MFLETLRSQTTDEQKKLFLEPAQNYEIIGCYAQTEYGHGSNVRELETTATWDPQSREFVIHSPTLTSAKCWIGGLGTAADHAIVMAQLFSDGKNLGPHPFIVPIRDRKTREPLPGRIVMDIGPKVGLNTVDNGSVIFDSVRIPHVNMMARFSRINADTGLYEKPKSAALAYGTMCGPRLPQRSDLAGPTSARALSDRLATCSRRPRRSPCGTARSVGSSSTAMRPPRTSRSLLRLRSSSASAHPGQADSAQLQLRPAPHLPGLLPGPRLRALRSPNPR